MADWSDLKWRGNSGVFGPPAGSSSHTVRVEKLGDNRYNVFDYRQFNSVLDKFDVELVEAVCAVYMILNFPYPEGNDDG